MLECFKLIFDILCCVQLKPFPNFELFRRRKHYWTANLFVFGEQMKMEQSFQLPRKESIDVIQRKREARRGGFLLQQWNTQNWWRAPLCNRAHCYILQCPISGLRKMYNRGKRWKGFDRKSSFPTKHLAFDIMRHVTIVTHVTYLNKIDVIIPEPIKASLKDQFIKELLCFGIRLKTPAFELALKRQWWKVFCWILYFCTTSFC